VGPKKGVYKNCVTGMSKLKIGHIFSHVKWFKNGKKTGVQKFL